MSISQQFIFYSSIWVLTFSIYIYIVRKYNYKTIGLGLVYLFNFSLVHFWGSVFFISDNYWNNQLDQTLVGYKYSTIAFVCFCFGSIIFYRIWGNNNKYNNMPIRNMGIGDEPFLYFLIGFFLFFILKNRLLGIPTVTAFVSMGQQLLILGICLMLYKSYFMGRTFIFSLLIIFSALIPFITIINDGFLGTGIAMFLTVLVFLSNFYKFNFRYIIIVLIGIYIGLSFYQSYLRDRDEIRNLVWGGASLTERIEQMNYTVTNVEFFNPFDSEHLDRINGRLNQNWIVGASVIHLESGGEEYAKGSTFKEGLFNIVPRVIWKNKPTVAGDTKRVEKYTGLRFAKNTSVGMPQVMEFYVNFAIYSVVIGFFLVGIIFSYLDFKSYIFLHTRDFGNLVFYFLPALAFMRVETPFLENMSGAAAGIGIAYGLQKLPKKYNSILLLLIMFILVLYILKKYYYPMVQNIL